MFLTMLMSENDIFMVYDLKFFFPEGFNPLKLYIEDIPQKPTLSESSDLNPEL